MGYYRKSSFGFTFIELILVITLLSVVSLAMFAVFNNGIKIWQRINKQLPQEDIAIFLDKFNRDLRNSFEFEGIKFTGGRQEISFATLVSSRQLGCRTVGRVTYSYQPFEARLSRRQDDFSQAFSSQENEFSQPLNNIKSLKFQYYFYNQDAKEYLWLDDWGKDSLPLAVRIELETGDTGQIRKFTQTVGLPLAN